MDSNVPTTREEQLSMLDDILGPSTTPEETFWTEMMARIRDSQVIPIIGNSLHLDGLFPGISKLPAQLFGKETSTPGQEVENYLAKAWARTVNYPLSDRYELARVAQYNAVAARRENKDLLQAKKGYLRFLKAMLLQCAVSDGVDPTLIQQQKALLDSRTFSDIAQELELPRLPTGRESPLRQLARLPFCIYVTTSHHDFIERALKAENKQPVTQVCEWSGSVSNNDQRPALQPGYVASANCPLVYHLFGIETSPTSLVLSEDDYLDFLVKAVVDTDANHPLIPLSLRSALRASTLVMFGYRLTGWDFRVLFRGIINNQIFNEGPRPSKSLIIQLDTGELDDIGGDQSARSYLQEYFGPAQFDLQWTCVEDFIDDLCKKYSAWSKPT